MANKIDEVTDKLWDIFCSMKTGLVLLGIIGLASGIGTLIPQETMNPEGAQAAHKLWQALGFTHLYTSWWFRFLLGLLAINLIVCSVQRFGSIYKQTFKPTAPKVKENVPSKFRCQITSENNEELQQRVLETLKKKGFRVKTEAQEENWSFIAQKRRFGNWGSAITHLSFVLLLIGALVGSLTGFKGFIMAGEGSSTPIQTINVDRGVVKENFEVRINSTEDRILENGERDNWYTNLSIIEDGKEVANDTISVNHPFSYKGITFYQASFAAGAKFHAEVNGEKIPFILQNRGGNYFQAPGTDLYLILAALQSDAKNPIALYQVFKGSQTLTMGQLNLGQSEKIGDIYTLTFDGMTGFTGLQVKKDPGIPIIWLGSTLLILGLILSFYWSSRTISGILEKKDKYVLTIGAYPGKANVVIQKEFEQIISQIDQMPSKGRIS